MDKDFEYTFDTLPFTAPSDEGFRAGETDNLKWYINCELHEVVSYMDNALKKGFALKTGRAYGSDGKLTDPKYTGLYYTNEDLNRYIENTNQYLKEHPELKDITYSSAMMPTVDTIIRSMAKLPDDNIINIERYKRPRRAMRNKKI